MSIIGICQSLTVNEWNNKPPVNKSNDDVLDVHILVQVGTGAKERVQRLQVELIWKDLQKNKVQTKLWVH